MSDHSRLRVAVDAASLVRDKRGLGRVTRAVLSAAFADTSIALTLLAQRRDDLRALQAEFAGATVATTSTAARKSAYDVVWFPFNGVRYATAAPSVVTIADAFAFTEPHPERIARAREQGPILRAARQAARVVTISQWSRGELERTLAIAPDRIDVVVPAPDPFWIPALGDTLPAGIAGTRFALVVGVREPRKNVRLVLEAFARAAREPEELLVIVGELSPADRAFARATGVRAGEIGASDALLRSLYREATVVLVPSLAEGFGLVAVEALACAAPVLAADAAALPEATAGAAQLLPPRDVAAWTAAIREVYDDPARASAMRARAAAAFAFSDRTAPARRMLEILRATAVRDAP